MLYLVKEPDPVLKGYSTPVTEFNSTHLKQLILQMIKIMNGRGVGIAAVQLGILEQVILIDPSAGKSLNSLRIMINPEIVRMSSEKELGVEGCLSLPGYQVPVLRSTSILISYQDEMGNERSTELNGFEARIAQHETDHLYGVTLSSYLNKNKLRI